MAAGLVLLSLDPAHRAPRRAAWLGTGGATRATIRPALEEQAHGEELVAHWQGDSAGSSQNHGRSTKVPTSTRVFFTDRWDQTAAHR